MRRLLLLLASALWMTASAATPTKPFVVVTEERQGDTVSLYANLQSASVVSLEMTLNLTNMKSSVPAPITRDLTEPKTLLTTLSKINPHEKSNYRYRIRYAVGRGNAKPDLAHVYKLPFTPGPNIRLRSGYGEKANRVMPMNEYLLMWDMPEGTPVLAAREGTVIGTRDDSNEHGLSEEYRSRANLVMVEHPDGTIADYVHLKYQGVAVKVGQQVKTGELLGYSGETGMTRGPNLLVRISRVNPAATRESLAAIWDTKEDYRTHPRSAEEGKGVERVSSSESVDSAK
jgi:murein DD-endopeptidase MepM/ murein hydrolase activator NlpD